MGKRLRAWAASRSRASRLRHSDREKHDHIERLAEKWTERLRQARDRGKPPPALDPEALKSVPKRDQEEPWYIYWSERGGTPQGIPPQYAPITVTPGMRLWLRLDEELLGATDEAGCYHRPEAVGVVLSWYEESIRVWMETVAGLPPDMPVGDVFRLARKLLRAIGAGRAEARVEADEEHARDRQERSGIKK